MAAASVSRPTGPPENLRISVFNRFLSLLSRPSLSTSRISSAKSATSFVITPSYFTWAKSRTRFKSRLASLGVPRERLAISQAPSSSIFTFKTFADRFTITASSSGE